MSKKPLISVIINVHNEAEHLKKCLESVRTLAGEIIVVDMNSTDGSAAVAASYGARVYPYKWVKFVEPVRNYAISKATGRWILLLDPDETIGKVLHKELLKITSRNDADWVRLPRKNIVFGKWLRHCRTWPDYLIRFFKKDAVTWQKAIHSQPVTRGNGLTVLDSDSLAIRHHHYQNIDQFLTRAIRYSQVQAEELYKGGYKVKVSDFLLKPVQEFNSRFFFAEGFKDGVPGLVFCLLQAIAVALIYLKLWQLQGMEDKTLPKDSFVSSSQEALFEFNHWFSRFYSEEYPANPFSKVIIKIRHFLFRITKNL